MRPATRSPGPAGIHRRPVEPAGLRAQARRARQAAADLRGGALGRVLVQRAAVALLPREPGRRASREDRVLPGRSERLGEGGAGPPRRLDLDHLRAQREAEPGRHPRPRARRRVDDAAGAAGRRSRSTGWRGSTPRARRPSCGCPRTGGRSRCGPWATRVPWSASPSRSARASSSRAYGVRCRRPSSARRRTSPTPRS